MSKTQQNSQPVSDGLSDPSSGEQETKRFGDIAHIKTGSRNNQDKVENGEYPFFVRSATVERINSYSFEGEAILVPGEGDIGNIFHYTIGRFDVHQRVYKISNFPAPYPVNNRCFRLSSLMTQTHTVSGSSSRARGTAPLPDRLSDRFLRCVPVVPLPASSSTGLVRCVVLFYSRPWGGAGPPGGGAQAKVGGRQMPDLPVFRRHTHLRGPSRRTHVVYRWRS